MVKLVAPLFSASARGQFGDLCEFRMVKGQPVATPIKERRVPLAAGTVAQAERFRLAAAAWKALSQAQKNLWAVPAALRGMSAYNLYIQQYLDQGIVAPAQPVIPT